MDARRPRLDGLIARRNFKANGDRSALRRSLENKLSFADANDFHSESARLTSQLEELER